MRTIERTIFQDSFVGSLNYQHRILWIGIILSAADDQGRFEDRPGLLRGDIFPDDDISLSDITSGIDAFERAGKVMRYTSADKKLVQILNWWRYQGGSAWMSASKFPAPDGWIDHERYHGRGSKLITNNWPPDSTATNSLPSHLPSQLPKGQSCREIKDKEDDNVEGDVNDNGASANLLNIAPDRKPYTFGSAVAIDIYCKVTGHMAIPSSKAAEAENMIGVILTHHKHDCVEYLLPFFQAWIKRGYNPSNATGWLDWAITGKIPPEKANGNGNGNGHKPTLEERNQAIFDRVLARRAAEELEEDE